MAGMLVAEGGRGLMSGLAAWVSGHYLKFTKKGGGNIYNITGTIFSSYFLFLEVGLH